MLLGAGPRADDSGALIILSTTLAHAQEVITADPYFTAPGVVVTSVRRWPPVVELPNAD